MYFSSMVKQELARIMPQNILEQKGELLAFIRLKGLIGQSDEALSIILENPVMIKVVYFLFKKGFNYEVTIDNIRKRNKKKIYLITVPDSRKTKYILDEFSLKANSQGKVI